jgi:hypothetical protein
MLRPISHPNSWGRILFFQLPQSTFSSPAIDASCGCQEDICTLLKVDSRLSVAQAVPPANATLWSRSTATLDPIQIAGRYLERVTKISRIAGIRLALAFSTVLTERY